MLVGLLMLGGGVAAGAFGSLLGLGGGVLIVPLLTLGFGLPLREAVGVSLICVIMTSSAAAGVYLERHVANMRLGHDPRAVHRDRGAGRRLDRVPARRAAAVVPVRRAPAVRRGHRWPAVAVPSPTVEPDPRRPTPTRRRRADATRTAAPADRRSTGCRATATASATSGRGVVGATGAGVVSALLGIGGGIIKVPLMHLAMGVPLRVATATSNMMIGITAAASAVIYIIRGGIDPYVAGPTAIGVFVGATAGSRLGHRVDLRYLRLLFVVVLVYTARPDAAAGVA